MTKVMTVVGTRPEIIRLSRVLARLDAEVDHVLVHTGQNWDYRLGDVFFDELGLRQPDHRLGVDTSSLGRVLGEILIKTEEVLVAERPDALLVLGDTNSSIAAVIAKRMQVPVFHMEAGNRSFDPNVPEEVNRKLVDHVADFNLVYTEHARRNLLAEGVEPRRIILTGSPMAEVLAHYRPQIDASSALDQLGLIERSYLLVSAHREENVDDPRRLAALLDVLEHVHRAYGLPVLVSTHPRTRKRLDALADRPLDGIEFHEPFGFPDYVRLQMGAFCVLSDSGTISEEAAILGFPAVTLRESIERPEAIDTGAIVLTGLDPVGAAEAIGTVVARHEAGDRPDLPAEYAIETCSLRAVSAILSTAARHHTWAGIRRRPEWDRAGSDPTGARGAGSDRPPADRG
jgi:UDP-N-acetylglucosamine 2-epimerase